MSTDRELTALAVVIEVEARRAGKNWHPQGLHATLVGLLHDEPDRPLDDIVVTACNAARDPKAQTPVAIGWPQYRPARRPGAVPADARCIVCGQYTPEACAHAQAIVPPEHNPNPHTYSPKGTQQ